MGLVGKLGGRKIEWVGNSKRGKWKKTRGHIRIHTFTIIIFYLGSNVGKKKL
jgi:hypothetical protein